ncbi:MAG: DNA primase [Nitrospinae bacterium]|nr:DNA primase [Nitrospinota bacterium]
MPEHIPQEVIEEVRRRCDIVEVISEILPLKGSGDNYKALCPFHTEKTPSFTVTRQKQIFHCFGCGVGGNVFHFIMKYEQLTFPEAVAHLARRCGVTLPKHTSHTATAAQDVQREQLYRLNEMAAEYYHTCLQSALPAEKARAYLKKRGIDARAVELFKLGYAPDSWDSLLRYGAGHGIRPQLLADVGLVKAREEGRGFYDRFRDRLMFPICDLTGRVVALGGRLLENIPDAPKYLNSPETAIYKKGKCLYGLHLTKQAIRREGTALIVEGYLDVISVFQAGIEHVVATLGTALTRSHVQVLKAYAREAVLVFDGDTAGRSAALRGKEFFLQGYVRYFLPGAHASSWQSSWEGDLHAKVVLLPAGHDPDTFVRSEGREALLARVQEGQPFIEFLLEAETEQHDLTSVQGKLAYVRKLLPLIVNIPNQVERTEYVSQLVKRTGIAASALADELHKLRQGHSRKGSEGDAHYFPSLGPERLLVHLLLTHRACVPYVRAQVPLENMQEPSLRTILHALYALAPDHGEFEVAALLEQLHDEHQRDLVARLVLEPLGDEDVQRQIDDCLKALQRRATEAQLKTLKEDMHEAERRGDIVQLTHLQQRFAQLRRVVVGQTRPKVGLSHED